MKAAQILRGRREGELLAFPSVLRMAEILSERCREPSWIRTSVASLERFRTMTDHADLEALLQQAREEAALAEQVLMSFARALAGYTDSQISALAMGPKIWLRLNGVPVSWRPLCGEKKVPTLPTLSDERASERFILLALIGSGLQMAELLRLRLSDVGSLDSEGRLIADVEADPLAVRFVPRRGKPRERITFFTYQARQALLQLLEQRRMEGQPLSPDAPLIVQPYTSSVARARQRTTSLIHAGSEVNVALCRTTGDFFREWGLPGSRFTGAEELNIEDFI